MSVFFFVKNQSSILEMIKINFDNIKKILFERAPDIKDHHPDWFDESRFLEESNIIGCKKKLNKLTEDEKNQFTHYGICPDCKEMNTGQAWCNKCDPGRFLKGKKSGNVGIDKLIHKAQRKTKDYHINLEWIPFDRLKDIELIGEGGFAKVYSATWLDGIPKGGTRKKERYPPTKVALKKLEGPMNITKAFINEVTIHHEYCLDNSYFLRLYGVTKDPKTAEFMMVLEFAEGGTLSDYLKTKFSRLKWEDKLEILRKIILNLSYIHRLGYVHKDLHSRNILCSSDSYISDFGLSEFIYESNPSACCGVLPYVAPEILSKKPYTFASDVYSFGIIMVEVSTGKPPYGNVPHDGKLALAICNGLRPRVAKGTPKCYIDFVNRCLDTDPKNRPSAEESHGIIWNWYGQLRDGESEIAKGFLNADKVVWNKQLMDKKESEVTKEFPNATRTTYTSSFFNYPNLPKPKNSTRVQIEDPEVSDSRLIELHISSEF